MRCRVRLRWSRRMLLGLRPIRLRRRTIIARRWFCRTVVRRWIRLRPIRFGPGAGLRLRWLWPIVRLRRRRAIIARWRFCRTIVRWWLIHLRTVRFWSVVGLRLTRLRLRRLRQVIRLRRGTIVPHRWFKRTIVRRRLIVWRRTIGLYRSRSRPLIASRLSYRTVRRLVPGRARRLVHWPPHGRCRRLSRRRLLHLRLRSWRIRRTQTCQVLPRDGLPRMCCHRLLLRCEGNWSRRRSHLSYHRAIRHGRRRCCHAVRRIGMNS